MIPDIACIPQSKIHRSLENVLTMSESAVLGKNLPGAGGMLMGCQQMLLTIRGPVDILEENNFELFFMMSKDESCMGDRALPGTLGYL